MNIQKYCTPYKYGQAVLSGSGHKGAFDEKGVDIPFVFSHGGRYYMMYTDNFKKRSGQSALGWKKCGRNMDD